MGLNLTAAPAIKESSDRPASTSEVVQKIFAALPEWTKKNKEYSEKESLLANINVFKTNDLFKVQLTFYEGDKFEDGVDIRPIVVVEVKEDPKTHELSKPEFSIGQKGTIIDN